MRKILLLFISIGLFTTIGGTIVVNAQPNNLSEDTYIGSNEYALDNMSDEYIKDILEKYHSYNETKTCNASSVEVTAKDIQEFKDVYASLPNNYSHYFNSAKWITRSGKISLSIDYKSSGMYIKGNNANAQAANVENAFRLLKNKHGSHKNWKNTASMNAQFHCHAITIGKLKNPWNIEPWRTESNLFIVTLKGCNP